uniref:Ubiquitin carboxyl-terminal hydrolase 20-like n=1 Tax=Tanacetum cinerariifolium TaxID=118510 RepID=A0A6L2J8H1_TANCI|nr:ubiquitin carboxyl-terminal hydrolase 20-like [Tanacetum cinerariifolium]
MLIKAGTIHFVVHLVDAVLEMILNVFLPRFPCLNELVSVFPLAGGLEIALTKQNTSKLLVLGYLDPKWNLLYFSRQNTSKYGSNEWFCLIYALRKLVENLSNFYEFLQCVLDRLYSSLINLKVKDDALPSESDNLVKQVLKGRLISKQLSDTYEPSVDLSLEIDSLSTALESFTKVERIEDEEMKFTQTCGLSSEEDLQPYTCGGQTDNGFLVKGGLLPKGKKRGLGNGGLLPKCEKKGLGNGGLVGLLPIGEKGGLFTGCLVVFEADRGKRGLFVFGADGGKGVCLFLEQMARKVVVWFVSVYKLTGELIRDDEMIRDGVLTGEDLRAIGECFRGN